MRKLLLSAVAEYCNEKIGINEFNNSFYISTDSMLSNRCGITTPESIPSSGKVTKYMLGDVLVSNIRPYFKKIWYANRTGGCSNDVLVFRAKENVIPKFLYYALSADSFFDYMMTGANGTKMPRGNKKQILSYELHKFEIETQQRIATILSRYDSLIENYQKQIKLLEEAAQRLYKEWFVDLRFPGYENTPVVDGVPEGWEKKKLGDIFSFVRGKSYTSKELSDSGTLMVNLKNIAPFGGYKRNAEKHFIGSYNQNQSLSKGDLVMGVTDMTKERRLVGHVAMVPFLSDKVTFSMDLIKLLPFKIPNSFLYASMRFGGISQKISPLANGVNVLHLKPEAIMDIEFVKPKRDLIDKYSKFSENSYEKIWTLEAQIRLLTEARDRLLPKLMSGEIEV